MVKYLNKTKIEWCDYTHNFMTGCLHGCEFCYARKMAHRFNKSFEPEVHPERLDAPLMLRTPSRIFEGSVTDMFGEWVEGDWLVDIFEVMEGARWHDFFVLTKNPRGIEKLYNEETLWYYGGGDYAENIFIGVSVTNADDTWRIDELKKQWVGHKFVSFEPLLGDVGEVDLAYIDWVIIGAQTQPFRAPQKKWVDNIVSQALKCGKPVFIKDNILVKMKYKPELREFARPLGD